MLSMALADCLRGNDLESLQNVPLLVGLAEPERPGGAAGLADSLIWEVPGSWGCSFTPTSLAHSSRDTRRASRRCEPPGNYCKTLLFLAVLCVGSTLTLTPALLWLEQYFRLKTEENSDGVIPGEAAAVVLVQRQPASTTAMAVEVSGLGFGHETANILTEAPLLGLGLAEAARVALAQAGLQMHEMDFRLSDVTGESYGFREQALAVARLLRERLEELPIWHCADSMGDTGAAASICQLVIAYHAFLKDYAPGSRAMCYTSAVPGDRAVAALQRQGG